MKDIVLPSPHKRGELVEASLASLTAMMRATQIQDVWAVLVDSLARFGFEDVNYGLTMGQVGTSIGDPQDALFLSTTALEAVIEHHRSGRYRNMPEYRWVLENVGAVDWGWADRERAAGRLSASECSALDQMPRSRQRAGYNVSFVRSQARAKGAMGLAAPASVSQADLDRVWREHGALIEVICATAHFRILDMPLRVPGAQLSARQREVLHWVADGKSVQDIALIMDLSNSAIEKHLRRARDTLNVETNAHAVAKLGFLNQLFVIGEPTGPVT